MTFKRRSGRQTSAARLVRRIDWPVQRVGASARLMARALDSMGTRVAQLKIGLYGEPRPLGTRNLSPESLDYVRRLLDSMGSNGEQTSMCYQWVGCIIHWILSGQTIRLTNIFLLSPKESKSTRRPKPVRLTALMGIWCCG